jgi:outer membrane lipoprotein-sorting protein
LRRSSSPAVQRLTVSILLLVVSGCSARRFTPPSGPGTPFPAFAEAFEQATTACRAVKTMTATLGLSGRAGKQGLRGRIDAGFAAPSGLRLEGRAPFGRPVFILAARSDANATLVLPRENRVLRDAPPAAIVEALAGVSLGPAELRSAIAGCGVNGAAPSGGTAYGAWVAIDVGEGTHYLRRIDDRWRLEASVRGPLTIEYRDFASNRPSTVRMQTTGATGVRTDLRVTLSDVNTNVPLEAEVFTVEIPPGADTLTLEELRRAGPLGDVSSR